MKIPEKAPGLKEALQRPITPELFIKTSELVKKANREYMYWDEFKYEPMPEGVLPEEAWAALKMARTIQARRMPLTDHKGDSFAYWLPDSILSETHFMDQQAGGTIVVDDPTIHTEEKRRYMIRSLVDEAISSSQIEGAITTRVVAKEMLRSGRKPKDKSEQMIYNNYLSMQMVKNRLSEPLSPELIREIHARMTEGTLDDPLWAGRFRTPADEDIHVFDSDGQTVLHVPPRAAEVPELMKHLCDYANADGGDEFVHPAVKGILIHFWLAYVHPFMDGNGRTARALFYWYMLKHRYWLFEYLSVSTGILSTRTQYYKAFLYSELDDNDATYFIAYNLRAIRKAIAGLNEYIKRKQREKRDAYRFVVRYPALNVRQRALLARALEKPGEVFTIETHSNIHGVTYQTARTDLLGLKDRGLLEMRKEGRKFLFTPAPDLAGKLKS